MENSGNKLATTIIDENLIGKRHEFDGPFGKRHVIYCDYTASGKPLHSIESFIMKEVLPVYGNTHTTTSITSVKTTLFRDEAREILRHAVGASEDDAVIFVGSGCTGAVHKLAGSLHLAERPIIFVGATDHHSNLLPWREIASRIIRIEEDLNGLLNTDALEHSLKIARKENRKMIGCFTVASNITGTLYQDMKITALLHQYGALSFWDYATAAPYVKIAMNPTSAAYPSGVAHKDAIYFSMHKFVGGVQTPGILVVKKALLKNHVPHGAGGGTVLFVDRNSHVYTRDIEMREEGGTPAIVENIRAGLVMKLKESVTAEWIMAREENLAKLAYSEWQQIPELILLGSTTAPRLALFSFVIRHLGTGYYLHHNFVCALLNDIYGIQARGGCACAGPYAQDLLGMDEALTDQFQEMIVDAEDGHYYDILRPGFTRLNLPYFAPDAEIDYIIKAVVAIAKHGWTMLPYYRTNIDTGEWHHHDTKSLPSANRKLLAEFDFSAIRKPVNYIDESDVATETPINYEDYLRKGNDIFRLAMEEDCMINQTEQQLHFDNNLKANKLRWFLFPNEANNKKPLNGKVTLPFTPRRYAKDIAQCEYHSQHYSTIPREDNLNEIAAETINERMLRLGNRRKCFPGTS